MAPALTRDQVRKRLKKIRIDLVDTVLRPAVSREAKINNHGLGQDRALQERLKTSVRGLSILYYFSFLESHVSDKEWGGIKVPNGSCRDKFTNVNWDWFDAFKYVRDCFGHDCEGSMFPANQSNTQRFQEIMAGQNAPPGVTMTNDRIGLTEDAVFECFRLVLSVLDEADLRPDL